MPQTMCAVKWCACLAVGESEHCAAHRNSPKLKPAQKDDPTEPPKACGACDGTGKCCRCYGTGDHECPHCDSSHECGACDGSGRCEECE